MDTRLWNPVSFTALAQVAYEAVYLDEDGGGFVRRPILGVIVEEEVKVSATGMIISTGVRRCNMAQQEEPGTPDIESAGGSRDFVGVLPVGEEPTPEMVRRAHEAMAEIDQNFAEAGAEIEEEVWPTDGWTGPVRVARRQDLSGDAVLTLPASAVRTVDDDQVEVTLPMLLMRWATDPV